MNARIALDQKRPRALRGITAAATSGSSASFTHVLYSAKEAPVPS